jgi:hypothetical protein
MLELLTHGYDLKVRRPRPSGALAHLAGPSLLKGYTGGHE